MGSIHINTDSFYKSKSIIDEHPVPYQDAQALAGAVLLRGEQHSPFEFSTPFIEAGDPQITHTGDRFFWAARLK